MVVVSSLPPPEVGVKLEQPCTRAFMNDRELGKGIVYIAESRLSWVDSSTGRGFSLEYPHISVHAISRDLQNYPHQCLYLMVDTNIDFLQNNGTSNETDHTNENENLDDGGDEDEMTEIRFVPDDNQALDAMYTAMSDCQALHPDPNDSISSDGGDENFDEDDEEFVDANGEFAAKNGDHEMKMEVEGQFDDAEEESGFVDQDD